MSADSSEGKDDSYNIRLPIPGKRRKRSEKDRIRLGEEIERWTGNWRDSARKTQEGLRFLLNNPQRWGNPSEPPKEQDVEMEGKIINLIIDMIRFRYRLKPKSFYHFCYELKHALSLQMAEVKDLTDFASESLAATRYEDERDLEEGEDVHAPEDDDFIEEDEEYDPKDGNFNPDSDSGWESEDLSTSMSEGESSSSTSSSASSSSSSSTSSTSSSDISEPPRKRRKTDKGKPKGKNGVKRFHLYRNKS